MTILYALLVLLVALLVTTVTSLYDLTIQLFTKQSWKTNVTKVPTVRTYLKYKDEYLTETYAYKVYDNGQRSIMAQFRSAILPLSIETGRYTYIPEVIF